MAHRAECLGKDNKNPLLSKTPYPDHITCLRLLKEAGCNEHTIEHSKTVHRLSMAIAKKMNEGDKA